MPLAYAMRRFQYTENAIDKTILLYGAFTTMHKMHDAMLAKPASRRDFATPQAFHAFAAQPNKRPKSDYEARGRRFESCRACQSLKPEARSLKEAPHRSDYERVATASGVMGMTFSPDG